MIFLAIKCLCFLLCCLIVLVGCTGKSALTAYHVFQRIKDKIDIPSCEIYTYSRDMSQNSLLIRLYSYDENAIPPAIAFCDDYLICLYHGNELWELHIFRTVSVYDNKRICEMLMSRRDILQHSENYGFFSESTQKRVMSADVFTFQNFVVLAITDDNRQIRKLLK